MSTRRRRLVGALLAGTAVCASAAACAGGAADAPAPADTITIEHSLGATTIEGTPQRVVTLGAPDADAVLALGVDPAGIHTTFGFPSGVGPWAEDELGDATPTVWQGRELDFEGIAAAGPDLILDVSGSGDRATYDTLSGIAPTIPLIAGVEPYSASWQDVTRTVATALRVPERGEAVVAEVEGLITTAAEENPGFAGRTFSQLGIAAGQVYVPTAEATSNLTFRELGLVPVPLLTEETSYAAQPLSLELLPRIDADVVLAYGYGSTPEEVVASVPGLADLPAAEAGRLYHLPDLALTTPTALSIPFGLADLVPFLQGALG